jgi:hypothetical protein
MIPLLAASEKGKGQAESSLEMRIEMWLKFNLRQRIEVFWKEML